MTVNTLFKEEELEGQLYSYLLPYYRQGLDAVIVQDLGALSLIRREFPGMDIHTSTQMTVTGSWGAAYMKQLGASRVVTAREMSFAEIRDIHEKVGIEIESFVHGALCYCYSGQCLLSSMLGGRSGNRGRCAQPCRLPYEVYDKERKRIFGEGEYVLSPKDLNTISLIPEMVESGIDSFKIEGRMKQAEYAAGVVSVYQEYIDRYYEDPKHYVVSAKDEKKLLNLGNRSGFTDGYYNRRNGREMITFGKPNHAKADETLQTEIRQKYVNKEIKEKINGILKLKKDFPATIRLSDGNFWIEQQGDIVQQAKKQPLSYEKVETNIRKTGNTPFVFDTLQIEMEDDVFLPIQALNALRRDALEQLEAALLTQWRRQTPKKDTSVVGVSASKCTEKMEQRENLAVSVELREQISPILLWDAVDDIYLDSSCYGRDTLFSALKDDVSRIHAAGKRAYYIFPAIFRKKTADFYEAGLQSFLEANLDGVVVKNYDAGAFVKNQCKGRLLVILDHSLYSWNNSAKEQLQDFSPQRDTVPLELNRKELYERDNRRSEILIYGRQTLMVSAQCVHANLGKCDGSKTVTYLKDRYGKYFPVKNNCAECYNTIYNTTPLVLFGFHEDFKRMGMAGYRIAFTTETEEEIQRVKELYRQTFVTEEKKVSDALGNGMYTNGHYKRGVE